MSDVLDDDAIARYARQIVVPGIGAAGQRTLLASHVLLLGDERGLAAAAAYLGAAGPKLHREIPAEPTLDAVLVADAPRLDDAMRRRALALGLPTAWYAVEEAGFTSGLAPAASVPGRDDTPARTDAAFASAALHQAAACEAASLLCAALLGLGLRGEPAHFSLRKD